MTAVLLSIQQKYIVEILRKLGCVRREQLRILVREKFRRPNMEITAARMEAMLRYAMGDIRLDGSAVWLGETQPDFRRLEAVDVMLELADGRQQDFSAAVRSPELLRFTLEGNSLRLFTVATLSDSLAAADPSRPGRTVWISDSGTSPPGLTLPPKHFFAARQPDGSHRFYGS